MINSPEELKAAQARVAELMQEIADARVGRPTRWGPAGVGTKNDPELAELWADIEAYKPPEPVKAVPPAPKVDVVEEPKAAEVPEAAKDEASVEASKPAKLAKKVTSRD